MIIILFLFTVPLEDFLQYFTTRKFKKTKTTKKIFSIFSNKIPDEEKEFIETSLNRLIENIKLH